MSFSQPASRFSVASFGSLRHDRYASARGDYLTEHGDIFTREDRLGQAEGRVRREPVWLIPIWTGRSMRQVCNDRSRQRAKPRSASSLIPTLSCSVGTKMAYDWDFSAIFLNGPLWLSGVYVTLIYSVVTISGGMLIGAIGGIVGVSPLKSVRYTIGLLFNVYVQLFRSTPLIVQIIWFYYALPIVAQITIPGWLAAGLGLTLYMGAFSTEIFRGGIISIDKRQWNAARSLGMTYGQMMRRIILPQAISRMMPAFANQAIVQLKNTSLLYVIAVPDLMYTGYLVMSKTYRPLETYTATAVIYSLMITPLQLIARRLEIRHDV